MPTCLSLVADEATVEEDVRSEIEQVLDEADHMGNRLDAGPSGHCPRYRRRPHLFRKI